jgi:hypothetical protein
MKPKEEKMENKILTDPMVEPKSAILESTLGKNYKLFAEFNDKIEGQGFFTEWNYYKDEKSWLCKVLFKKKNYCWLSIWNTGFKLTFYFTDKTIKGLFNLDISEIIKKSILETKPVGKFRPVMLLIKNKNLMNGALKILDYKMKLK